MADSILTRARPLLVARLAGAVLALAVPMVLARVLLPASYGTFKQAWLVSQTIALVLPLGLTQSLYYFVPRAPRDRDRYVSQTVWAHLVLGLLSAGLVLAARGFLAGRFQNPELDALLGWVAAFTGLFVAGAPLDVAWNAAGRIGAAALGRLATEVLRSLALVAGAVATGSVRGALVGMTLATGARAVANVVLLARDGGLGRPSGALLRRQIAYALPFGLAFLLVVPQQQFHQYAVSAAVTAAAFAVYSVGTFQLPIVDVLYSPVSELLQIGLADADGAGRPRAGLRLFHEAVAQLAFAFLPLAGLLAVVAPALIELVFSPVYLPAVPIFRLSVIPVALAALPLDGVMRARAQNRFVLALSAAKLALTVPLVLGGLAWRGPIGAFGGWIAAEALARGVMLVRTAALFEAPLARVLPVRTLVRLGAATGLAMPPSWLALQAVPGPLLARLAAAGLVFGAAYLGLAWARGWLPAGWIGLFRGRAAAPRGPMPSVSEP